MPTLDAQHGGLAALQAQLAAVAGEPAARRQAAVPRQVQRRLQDLDAEYAPAIDVLEREIAAATTQVKAGVLQYGHSVQAHGLHAVVVAGRVSWNDAALQGYAQGGHAEILAFRTAGKPSVSLHPAPGESSG